MSAESVALVHAIERYHKVCLDVLKLGADGRWHEAVERIIDSLDGCDAIEDGDLTLFDAATMAGAAAQSYEMDWRAKNLEDDPYERRWSAHIDGCDHHFEQTVDGWRCVHCDALIDGSGGAGTMEP